MVAFTEFDGKLLSGQSAELVAFVKQAAVDGLPAHEVELGLFRGVMKLGRELLSAFFGLQGTGDIGPEMTLPDGSQLVRQPEIHERQYATIFGEYTIPRAAYVSAQHGQLVAGRCGKLAAAGGTQLLCVRFVSALVNPVLTHAFWMRLRPRVGYKRCVVRTATKQLV